MWETAAGGKDGNRHVPQNTFVDDATSHLQSPTHSVNLTHASHTTDEGIPEFWLTVLLKSDITCELIKDKDLEVLKYLTEITVSVWHGSRSTRHCLSSRGRVWEAEPNPNN